MRGLTPLERTSDRECVAPSAYTLTAIKPIDSVNG